MGVPYRPHALVVAAGFFGVFASFSSAQALATTLSSDKTLANVSLACLYLIFTIFCVPAPKLVTHIGPKLSMITGSLPYALFVLAFLYQGWGTTLPANILVGLGAPLLWTGQSVYISRCAMAHAAETGTSPEAATSYFNGLFFALFSGTGFIGTLASSLILNYTGSDSTNYLFIVLSAVCGCGVAVFFFLPPVTPPSSSANRVTSAADGGAVIEGPSYSSRVSSSRAAASDAAADVAAAAAVAAAASAGPVPASETAAALSLNDARPSLVPHSTEAGAHDVSDPPTPPPTTALQSHAKWPAPAASAASAASASQQQQQQYESNRDSDVDSNNEVVMVGVLETLRLAATDPKVYLLAPLIFYQGMSQGFLFSDITVTIVRPALGEDMVPYFLAAFYGCEFLFSYLWGRLAAGRVGRRGVLTAAAAAHVAYTLWALLWAVPNNYIRVPTPGGGDEEFRVHAPGYAAYLSCFFGAMLYAAGDSVYMGQIPAILQSFFKSSPRDSDAAMSGQKMFQSFGTAVQFGLGFLLKDYFKVKAGINVGMHALGVLFVIILSVAVAPLDGDSGSGDRSVRGAGAEDGDTGALRAGTGIEDSDGEYQALPVTPVGTGAQRTIAAV